MHSTVLASMKLIIIILVISYTRDFFVKQKSLVKKEIFDEMMNVIESRLLSEATVNMITKSLFDDIMREVETLQLLEQNARKIKETNSVLMETPELKRKKNSFSSHFYSQQNTKPPKSNLSLLQSTQESIESNTSRLLFEEEQSASLESFEQGKCNERPILSPFNPFNKFQYDERIEKTLSLINAISSSTSLGNYDSPQYKAACWILFDDAANMSFESGLMVQRYILAVFLYSTISGVKIDMLLAPNTCDSNGITCNEKGQVTNITMGEPF